MAKSYFGENLRRIRQEQGMTQSELAKLLMTDVSAISKWELGQRYPQVIWIYEIAHKLGVTPEDLIRQIV